MRALFEYVWAKVKAKTAEDAETNGSGQLFVLWGDTQGAPIYFGLYCARYI